MFYSSHDYDNIFTSYGCYSHKLFFLLQDNYNVLHIAAMYSREDVVKLLLNKRGVDPFSTGGVSILINDRDKNTHTQKGVSKYPTSFV